MSETKGIWIINTAPLENGGVAHGMFGTMFDRPLADEIMRALRTHCFSGKADTAEIAKDDFADFSIRNRGNRALASFERAVEMGLRPVFLDMNPLYEPLASIRDWASQLLLHSPRIYSAILRKKVSFAQMIEHAARWHAAAAKRAERLRDRGIERDDVGAPTVLALDGEFQGWRWVWLKSDDARDAEGRVMGHCVGDGFYDSMGGTQAVFSLRDTKNQPHVTVELDGLELEQAQCRGNTSPPEHYQPLIDRLVAVVGLRLEVKEDPSAVVADGVHQVDCRSYDGEIHVAGGVLHREGGPAVISKNKAEFWLDGRETQHHITIYNRPIEEEWYDPEGRLHRDGGPARIAYTTTAPDGAPEWWQHGERHEEDGSPWVEPAHYTRGYALLEHGGKISVATESHTSKGPDMSKFLEINDRLTIDQLRSLGAHDVVIKNGELRKFKIPTVLYEISYAKDRNGQVSISATTTYDFLGGGMLQHAGRQVYQSIQAPMRSILPVLRERESYLVAEANRGNIRDRLLGVAWTPQRAYGDGEIVFAAKSEASIDPEIAHLWENWRAAS